VKTTLAFYDDERLDAARIKEIEEALMMGCDAEAEEKLQRLEDERAERRFRAGRAQAEIDSIWTVNVTVTDFPDAPCKGQEPDVTTCSTCTYREPCREAGEQAAMSSATLTIDGVWGGTDMSVRPCAYGHRGWRDDGRCAECRRLDTERLRLCEVAA
jgi:hypothetical protein